MTYRSCSNLRIHLSFSGANKKISDILDLEHVKSNSLLQIPIAAELLSAGFASPAQDFIEKSVDLNEMLITNEYSTFIGKVGSRSMLNAGIDINDKLIIDRSFDAKHLDIIVAQLETDFTVKRLMITKQMSAGEINEIFGPDAKSIPPVWLKAENQEHSHIFLKPEQELIVWGVVTYIIKDARK
uniref:Peptidase S24/S26A/S26B/S26C domain-containing protein n=1 Tax=Acinetobacter ursingii TaxID=108980 RepID=A0A499RLY9_9GAMM|nr:hypothetical protein [Acinetobacter ursingii]